MERAMYEMIFRRVLDKIFHSSIMCSIDITRREFTVSFTTRDIKLPSAAVKFSFERLGDLCLKRRDDDLLDDFFVITLFVAMDEEFEMFFLDLLIIIFPGFQACFEESDPGAFFRKAHDQIVKRPRCFWRGRWDRSAFTINLDDRFTPEDLYEVIHIFWVY